MGEPRRRVPFYYKNLGSQQKLAHKLLDSKRDSRQAAILGIRRALLRGGVFSSYCRLPSSSSRFRVCKTMKRARSFLHITWVELSGSDVRRTHITMARD